MSILLLFIEALEAVYLSAAHRDIIQKYHNQIISLGVIPRVGEKLILEAGTKAAYFEIVDVTHRMPCRALSGGFAPESGVAAPGSVANG
ncbi:MAG: hypothetical protein HC929_13250 [Leptolyngbyaceae cyanobacterium SM2_5_2]|nr:hypothetical protein [Leptolyngbyaceae cyanobacterium SM2_5_2]